MEYFFVKIVLFGHTIPSSVFEPSSPINLGQTLRSLGASSSSHCLGHRELVYKLSAQTTSDPHPYYGLDRMRT